MTQSLSKGELLRDVARLHTRLQRLCVSCCEGTTVTQCTVLTELSRNSPMTLAELSRRVGLDKNWTSRAVEQLVQEGLVEKFPGGADRRTVRLSLSGSGIAEFSVYVRRDWRGKGAGRLALSRLIKECERARFWKLVSRVFVENTASRALLQASGFREVGVYKKHGQLDGIWHDVVIVEYLLPSEDISASFDCELSSMTNRIDEAKPSDLASILVLLAHAGLPSEGLAELLPTTIVARQSGIVIGCAALEIYGTVALLRSVAVDPTHRLHGLGRLLVEKQLQQAHRRGIQNIYLLTETAHDYFQRFSFRPIERSAVSPAIHQSVEWTSVCPVSAQAMVRPLENG